MTHEENTSGWDAIDQAIGELYGEQEPHHYGTSIPYMLGGRTRSTASACIRRTHLCLTGILSHMVSLNYMRKNPINYHKVDMDSRLHFVLHVAKKRTNLQPGH